MQIREEQPSDYEEIYQLVQTAFKTAEHSCGTEQNIVVKIRESDNYIKSLSLVGILQGKIIGHVMISKISIVNNQNTYNSYAIAPLSIAPDQQRKGYGSQLMKEVISRAQKLGITHLTLFGDDHFYHTFGFETSTKYGIKTDIPCDENNCMVIQLQEQGLTGINGIIKYPDYFFK
ncbi:acetyltransferase, GNAT family protein [Entamoeba histolytica HM-3:IMSS]|uniref:Acetyltransferase GNAT family protein, putative n=2 Tax=Entamoeba histolytica TaxID=5759 RepID=M2R9E7_ENTHI|nr:acetyltransferase GNAT family protein, putative [Entamoeba histolytica KU27]EMS17569.1 acetyltransferase, GNAT family protein [Entamoeba histolytica HM-3:IMSS]